MSFLRHLNSDEYRFHYTFDIHAIYITLSPHTLSYGDRFLIEIARDGNRCYHSSIHLLQQQYYNSKTQCITLPSNEKITFKSTLYNKKGHLDHKKFSLSIKKLGHHHSKHSSRKDGISIASKSIDISVYADLKNDNVIERHIKLENQVASSKIQNNSNEKQQHTVLHCTVTSKLIADKPNKSLNTTKGNSNRDRKTSISSLSHNSDTTNDGNIRRHSISSHSQSIGSSSSVASDESSYTGRDNENDDDESDTESLTSIDEGRNPQQRGIKKVTPTATNKPLTTVHNDDSEDEEANEVSRRNNQANPSIAPILSDKFVKPHGRLMKTNLPQELQLTPVVESNNEKTSKRVAPLPLLSPSSVSSTHSEIDDFLSLKRSASISTSSTPSNHNLHSTTNKQQQRRNLNDEDLSPPNVSQQPSSNPSTASDLLYTSDMTATDMIEAEDVFANKSRPLLQKLINSTLTKQVNALKQTPNRLRHYSFNNNTLASSSQPPHHHQLRGSNNVNLAAAEDGSIPTQRLSVPPLRKQRSISDLSDHELALLVKRLQIQKKEKEQQRDERMKERMQICKTRNITPDQLIAEERREQRRAMEEVERRKYEEQLAALQQQTTAKLQSERSLVESQLLVNERYWNSIPTAACIITRCLLHWHVIDNIGEVRLKPSIVDTLTKKERQRMSIDPPPSVITTQSFPQQQQQQHTCYPRRWLYDELNTSLWQLTVESSLNEAALCFLVNNACTLLHLLSSYAESRQSNSTGHDANIDVESITNYSKLTISVQPLKQPQHDTLTVTAPPSTITPSIGYVILRHQHYLSNTISHLLKHAIAALSTNVRVSHLISTIDITDNENAVNGDDLMMIAITQQSNAVATLIDTLQDIYNAMKDGQLMTHILHEYLLLLVQHVNAFLCNFIFSDRSLCTLSTAMQLQIVSSALAAWAHSIDGEFQKDVQHAMSHMKQIALLLLSNKQKLSSRYERYRTPMKKGNNGKNRVTLFDILSQYHPLNPAQIYYLLMHHTILIEQRQAHTHSNHQENGSDAEARDVVSDALLKYIQKEAKKFKDKNPIQRSMLQVDNEVTASTDDTMLLLNDDNTDFQHILVPTDLTMDFSLRSVIGKFSISAATLPIELANDSGFAFLTNTKQRIVL